MEINKYQEVSIETAVYPSRGGVGGLEYTLFGLLGEAGELANKYKKILRNDQAFEDHKEMLMDELGDVLWYASAFAKELGYTLEEVCQFNINKLKDRQATGTLKNRE